MKKTNFKKMAIMGMAGGMLLASQSPINAQESTTAGTYLAGGCDAKSGCSNNKGRSDNLPSYYHQANTQNRNSCGNKRGYTADASSEVETQVQSSTKSKSLTESELLSQLNEQGRATFQSLTPEGKTLALKLANQDCKGKNDCKGQNSCKSKDNSCAGKGSCKGTAQGKFTDKNTAVKVAAKVMADKRNSATKSSY